MRTLFITLFLATSAAHAECPNPEAYVLVDSAHSQELINAAAMINSIPLTGVVKNPGNATDGVLISVPDWYARAHEEISAFDVAQKVEGIAKAYPQFGVHRIEAVVCFGTPDFSFSNAGTIGHGR